jgi:hypothetical protein
MSDCFEEAEWEFYCHMTRDGSCGAAGSEECEFLCPYRAEQRANEHRQRNRKQGRLFS